MTPAQLPGYVGPLSEQPMFRLPRLRGGCVARAPRELRVTEKGYRKGCRPGNWNRKFPPEPLTSDEVLRLIAACPNTKAGVRNHALVALLWRTGLRIGCEALHLRPHHVDFDARSMA